MPETLTDTATGKPAPALRGLVRRYSGHRHSCHEPGLHRGLPSRHLTLYISLEDPISIVQMPRDKQSPGAYQAFLGGLHDGPALVAHGRHGCGIGIEVTPQGARALFGIPAAALAYSVIDLGEGWPGLVDPLVDGLVRARTWAERFRILEQTMLGLLGQSDGGPRPELVWAWNQLGRSGGTVTVASLARELGWSRRHLTSRFAAEFGLGPKTMARVMRFERASSLLQLAPTSNLAQLAATCGFYDQAHMTSDWGALAGITPGAWLAEEFKDPPDESFAA